jgi:phosphate transport system permease protein
MLAVRKAEAVRKADWLAKVFLWLSGGFTVAALMVILSYIMFKGVPYINWEFLTTMPKGMGDEGGILPSIVGTVYLTALTIVLAVPIGTGAGMYLADYSRDGWFAALIRSSCDLLAGVPSIVLGLFGYGFFVITLKPLTHGWSLISAALTGVTMVLPTLVRTAEEAIKSVPATYREASLALGASKWQTMVKVILPAALPGLVTGVILAMGRVVGETAAFLLTLGGSQRLPGSIFAPARTLALHLYLLVMEVGAMDKAFAIGAVLIVTLLVLNSLAGLVARLLLGGNSK